MATRKPISKKTRFEVFKRDKFQCQYCGRVSPDVVLEIDHIQPVVDGGSNEITNLLTACFDCNRGKGKRALANDDVLRKSYKETADLSERREQLEMMMEWRNSVKSIDKDLFDMFSDTLYDLYGFEMTHTTDKEKAQIRRSLKKYGIDHVERCCELVYRAHCGDIDFDTFISDIRNKCYWERENEKKPELRMPYIVGILRNRFGNEFEYLYHDAVKTIAEKGGHGKPIYDDMKDIAVKADSFEHFLKRYGFCVTNKGDD